MSYQSLVLYDTVLHMKATLIFLALCLTTAAYAKDYPHQQAKVTSAKTVQDYERDDCAWRVPCPMLKVSISSSDFQYTLVHALKKHQDASWLHAGDQVTFMYDGKHRVAIQGVGGWWVFAVTEREQTTPKSIGSH